MVEPPSCRRQIGSWQLWSASEVKFAFARPLWIFRFASFQTRLSTFSLRGCSVLLVPFLGGSAPVRDTILMERGVKLPWFGARLFWGGGSCQKGSETVPSWGQTESGASLGVWTASTPTTSPHQANQTRTGQLEWVSVSPPPTCRWWSAGKYRTTSTPEDTGQPEEAMDMGVISDPQILRSDRNFVSMPVPLAKVAQIRHVGTMSVDLVVHRRPCVINNPETPNSPASSTAIQLWGAFLVSSEWTSQSSKQPTFQTDSRQDFSLVCPGSETSAISKPPQKEDKTTPKKNHSISILNTTTTTTLLRPIPSNKNQHQVPVSPASASPPLPHRHHHRLSSPPSKETPLHPSTVPPNPNPTRRASGFGTLPSLPRRPRPGSPFSFLFSTGTPSRRRQTPPPGCSVPRVHDS